MISITKALKLILVLLLTINVNARIKVNLNKVDKEEPSEYLTEEEENKKNMVILCSKHFFNI